MTNREIPIDITPRKRLMSAFKYSGYSTVEAIAELIDNSLDARFGEEPQKIIIDITPEHITVRDTGKAMDETGLGNSIRLGFSEKEGQHGKHGLGLKTASLSLGDKFTIQTKPAGAD